MKATSWVISSAMKMTLLIFSISAAMADLDEDYRDTFKVVRGDNNCTEVIYHFNALIHKPKYIIGVFDDQGDEHAMKQQYNMTFDRYLTATAGRKFDHPIDFDIIPVTLTQLLDLAKEEKVDFTFATAAASSCMQLERKAQALATVVNRRNCRGRDYDLDVYGGVMFTLASNTEVNSLQDLKDKVIGAGGITMMGGGLSQFYEMVKNGLSYVADPKQVIFTGDGDKTVQGVLDKEFDVGFARTDQIERHLDANGKPLNPELFKILNPRTHVLDDGTLFPFLSSTQLAPESLVSALNHVSKDVAREVQEALLALREHYSSVDLGYNMRCDTTPELAQLAKFAAEAGLITGFRTARSYSEVRTTQEKSGVIKLDETANTLTCVSGGTLYEDLECPEGHFKLSKDDFLNSCEALGLECKDGYECYCKPCVKAFEVELHQLVSAGDTTWSDAVDDDRNDIGEICSKMSLCGSTQQTKVMTMRLRDNMERVDPEVVAAMHLDQGVEPMKISKVPGEQFIYEFQWARNIIGVGILEIFFDGEQIPQSPVRIQVVARQCEDDYPGERRTNNSNGVCVCNAATMDIGGRCVESVTIAVVVSISGIIFAAIIGVTYFRYRNHKNDQVWLVNIDELHFDDPAEVIGQGSFGVVLLGEYRGTKVALKRALKINKRAGSKRSSKRNQNQLSSSKNGSRVKGPNDSAGLDSFNTDEEMGNSKTGSGNNSAEGKSSSNGNSHSVGGNHSAGSNTSHSLAFLAADFGTRNKWSAWLPWIQNDDHHGRFKQAILGDTGSGNVTKTWHARLCPWFNAQVRAQEEFICEMRVLSRLRHPCITTVMGAVVSNSHDPMLVMEYMEYGSLHDLLRNETLHLSGEFILQVCRDVAQGLRFLHSSKPSITHGDLKGRNILIDSRFRAKLCDFGLSTKRKNTITGTPYCLAPEYLRGQTEYTTSCDMYSVGVVIYEMYARQDPYVGEDFRDTLRRVCDRRINKRPEIPVTCPLKMVDLMKKCWSPDVFFRPEAKDLDNTLLDMNARDAELLTPEEQLQNKKKRSGNMLYELFPKHIADALKAGQKVEAEQHEEVTVVFSEISHFADIARNMSPLKVSGMLDRLYMAFDAVACKHSVFKVETVGDAYMGVTNLEKNQQNTHTKNAALFAIDLVTEAGKILIDEEKPELGFVSIRAGFHTGPVVANVVGSLNPRYGLFGDTVNTASRMQTNSKAGRILCSEAAFIILEAQAPEIPVKKRGKIAVKGKGDMVAYWVGDENIMLRQSPNVTVLAEEDKKHVDFLTGEEPTEAVNENLWRRDLKSKLDGIELSVEAKSKKVDTKKKSRDKLSGEPVEKITPGRKTGNVTIRRSNLA